MPFNSTEHPHRRRNPLTGEYVLVSPHRAKRPWQGQVEKSTADERPAYEPSCYLCPGNTRTSGAENPDYQHTHVFTNDFAALQPDAPSADTLDPLFDMDPVRGTCRVMCLSPRHDLTLAEMSVPEIIPVIDAWADETTQLGETYRWVQVFENKGAVMGSSMPHPHGQIWALNALPNEPKKENLNKRSYFESHATPLLMDYAAREAAEQTRVVIENEDWLAVVPFWAVWPFEMLLMPRAHRLRLPDLTNSERASLAAILRGLLVKYDNLFETSFPYSMGWHGAPYGKEDISHWQLHAHFYPPLLRSATVKKFMVGFEMLGEAQRDLTAEQAAERLRALPDVHYKSR